MGVIPAVENSCAAIWLAIPQGQALAGIEWFNNDGTLPFPGLYFESGVPESPVSLEQTVLAAENVSGESAGWSAVEFNEPVTCASEGLYLVFRFPAGVQVTAFGAGGGPGIGYVADGAGAPGWLCSDGQSWDKVGREFGFAVLPILVAGSEGMIQLNGSSGPVEPAPEAVPLVTTLARSHLEAGKHLASWRGVDASGRRVASGVYFARFKAGNVVMNHRLVLIK